MIKYFICALLVAALSDCLPQSPPIKYYPLNDKHFKEDIGKKLSFENYSTEELRGLMGEMKILPATEIKHGNRDLQSTPTGYEYYPGFGYYKFYPMYVRYFDALDTCAKDGAHLLTLNSDAEYELVKNIYAQYPAMYEFAFVGFHDMFTEGDYKTIFGYSLAENGFTKWKEGNPSNSEGNEDCGSVHRTEGLNDIACTSRLPFICELEE